MVEVFKIKDPNDKDKPLAERRVIGYGKTLVKTIAYI